MNSGESSFSITTFINEILKGNYKLIEDQRIIKLIVGIIDKYLVAENI